MGDIRLERALAIEGWMSPVELRWLAENAQNCNKILEVGSYKGRSTRALCDNCPGTVTAVDPWSGPYITDKGSVLFDQSKAWKDFQINLEGCSNLIIVRKYFSDYLRIYNINDYDLVFLDGDHRYNKVLHDIAEGMRILKPGGILAGHDYTHPDWPGVKKAVDEILPERKLVSSIWWIQK